jgi:hypothetical protein
LELVLVAERMDSDLREGIAVDKHVDICHIHMEAFAPAVVVPPSPY